MSDTERKRTPAQVDAFQEGSGFGTQRSKPGPTRTRGPRRQIPICFAPYYATGVDGNTEHGDAGARSSRSTADHASPSQMPAVTVYCISVFGHVKRRFGPLVFNQHAVGEDLGECLLVIGQDLFGFGGVVGKCEQPYFGCCHI
jgi:hypothetical protein